jgi:hypothetical protein
LDEWQVEEISVGRTSISSYLVHLPSQMSPESYLMDISNLRLGSVPSSTYAIHEYPLLSCW